VPQNWLTSILDHAIISTTTWLKSSRKAHKNVV